MIQTQQPFDYGKKPRLFLKKKYVESEEVKKYSYLFKQCSSSTFTNSTLQHKEDPLKILIKDVFCFRTIKSITRNDNYVSLKLKEPQNQRLCINTHIQRFKSSESKTYQYFGKYLELFDLIMKEKSLLCSRVDLSEAKNLFEKQLQDTLFTNRDKKFLIFYYEPSAKLLNFSQVFISISLLNDLGYDPNEFCQDFLKYRHLFFQIFQTSLLEKIMLSVTRDQDELLKNSILFQTLLQTKNISSLLAKKKSVEINFQDIIFRRVQAKTGIVQQKLAASFKYTKPQVNISMIELNSMDSMNVIQSHQKKIDVFKREIQKSQQKRIEKQIYQMKKLMHQAFALNQQDLNLNHFLQKNQAS